MDLLVRIYIIVKIPLMIKIHPIANIYCVVYPTVKCISYGKNYIPSKKFISMAELTRGVRDYKFYHNCY